MGLWCWVRFDTVSSAVLANASPPSWPCAHPAICPCTYTGRAGKWKYMHWQEHSALTLSVVLREDLCTLTCVLVTHWYCMVLPSHAMHYHGHFKSINATQEVYRCSYVTWSYATLTEIGLTHVSPYPRNPESFVPPFQCSSEIVFLYCGLLAVLAPHCGLLDCPGTRLDQVSPSQSYCRPGRDLYR
jgi:hypothetical protein